MKDTIIQSDSYFEADTDDLINTCVQNPYDVVCADAVIGIKTGGRQIDDDDFEDGHTEIKEVILEAKYIEKDNIIVMNYDDESIVILEIKKLEV